MSRYKTKMFERGIMQKEVCDKIRTVDERVDKALFSKIVNDIVLPTPKVLKAVCKALTCDVLDLYDKQEIYYISAPDLSKKPDATGISIVQVAVNPDTERTRKRRAKSDFYNLTVEIPRSVAERVFSPAALRKLGYKNKADCVRRLIDGLILRLDKFDDT